MCASNFGGIRDQDKNILYLEGDPATGYEAGIWRLRRLVPMTILEAKRVGQKISTRQHK